MPAEHEYFFAEKPGPEVRDAANIWLAEENGDFAMRDEDGLYYILGRSDDTIKVSGKRTTISLRRSPSYSNPAGSPPYAAATSDCTSLTFSP